MSPAADTSCDRFEKEGLLRIERGEELDPHFDSCPDCREARLAYERLVDDLARAGDDDRPVEDWKARVRARIGTEDPADGRSRNPWPARLAAILVLGLGLGLWLSQWQRSGPSGAPEIGLAVTLQSGTTTYRGESAELGDRILLSGPMDEGYQTELRIYLDDRELLLRCSEAPPCQRQGDRLEAALEIEVMGRLRPVLLRSENPLPEPSGEGMDLDLGMAAETGAELTLGDEILVR